jgi:predicted molibdopterin-dependent oxidoreductase YjgC
MGIKPEKGGLTLQEMLDLPKVIRGLLIFGDDLLNHLPSFSFMEKLKNLEFLLVADRFLTDTVQIADCAFPIPVLAEGTGTLTNCEGRVQQLRPVLSPKEEIRPLSYLLSSLSRKLGINLPAQSDKNVRREISRDIPHYQTINDESELDSLQGIVLSSLNRPSIPPISSEKGEGPQEAGKYRLFIPNTLYAWNRNQMILDSPVLKIEYPEDRKALRMNRQDVRDLRLRPGEKIKVCSEHGDAQIGVEIDDTLPPRTLVLPMHFSTVIENLAGKREFDHITNYSYCPDLSVTLERV